MSVDLDWAVQGPPIGTWTTSNGTFDAVMQDTLTLTEDGNGWLRSQSRLRGQETLRVIWQQPSPGVLNLALTLAADDPQEDPFYETVRYFATAVSNDVGKDVLVLQNTDDNVFWNLSGPIALGSRIPRTPS